MKAAPSMQIRSNSRLQRQLLGFRAAQSKPSSLSLPSLRCEAGKPEPFQQGHQGTDPDPGELTSPRERRAGDPTQPHNQPGGTPIAGSHTAETRQRPQEKTSKGPSLSAYSKAKAPSHESGRSIAPAPKRHLLSPNVKQMFSRANSSGLAQHLLNSRDLPGHGLQRGSGPKVFN